VDTLSEVHCLPNLSAPPTGYNKIAISLIIIEIAIAFVIDYYYLVVAIKRNIISIKQCQR